MAIMELKIFKAQILDAHERILIDIGNIEAKTIDEADKKIRKQYKRFFEHHQTRSVYLNIIEL